MKGGKHDGREQNDLIHWTQKGSQVPKFPNAQTTVNGVKRGFFLFFFLTFPCRPPNFYHLPTLLFVSFHINIVYLLSSFLFLLSAMCFLLTVSDNCYMVTPLAEPSTTLSERLMRSWARQRFVAASSRRTEEKVASRRGSGRHWRRASRARLLSLRLHGKSEVISLDRMLVGLGICRS